MDISASRIDDIVKALYECLFNDKSVDEIEHLINISEGYIEFDDRIRCLLVELKKLLNTKLDAQCKPEIPPEKPKTTSPMVKRGFTKR